MLKLADGSIFTGRQALQNKLIDTLGGEDEIRTYLETRKVSKDLPIVDWKPEDKSSSFFWPSAAAWLLNGLGYGDFLKSEGLQKIMTEKLFLDGLLSVWQGAAN